MMSNSERAMLADAIDEIDAEIKVLNKGKSDAFKAHREKLEARGMDARRAAAEVAAIKAAVVRRRKLVADPDAVREKDDLTDEILIEIMGPSRAREAAPRENHQNTSNSGASSPKTAVEGIDPETGEITEPTEPAPQVSADAPEDDVPIEPSASGVDQSTAALTEVRDNSTEGEPGKSPLDPGAAITPPADQPPVDTQPTEFERIQAEMVAKTFNRATHFRSSGGFLRLHGCQDPEVCAGSHRELCHTCRRVAEAA